MSFTDTLGIKFPIIQAPMAGVSTPVFVAAAAEANILGSIGAGYLSGEATREFIQEVKKLTNKPFAVNLFVPEDVEMDQELIRQAYLGLQPVGKKLGMPFWKAPLSASSFVEQVAVIIEEDVKICSFTFGLPDEAVVRKLKEHDVFLIGTATTVEEAVMAEKVGMDALVAQGKEAGGHRGSFLDKILVPLDELLPSIVEVVSIPVIAAGGIANKEHLDQQIAQGAVAVQIGTALLATEESGAHPLYKEAILGATENSTDLTKAFSGKPARGIRNQFIEMMKDIPIAPYPYQNDLTKKIRSEAAAKGRPEFMSLWAGESVHETVGGTVKEIVERFI
ncbi:NAD(P)H-dependent flavin oxidoreductase [Sporosarcina highlanderae]|uniref:Probable nitronate monooxygenase n=1 Tax=Sporosarcina highlanderae TaxID=3035916 RepID=A0ABT8JN15_9BACL|nr:nitronate monooxygenase [Sporosarcina highlanderae]MDN4606465.1 nitronate monooxygenase [Sporosarcina highlanderae]